MSTSTARTANRALWAAQILAALIFLFAGSMKFIMPPAQMQQGPLTLPIPFLRFIGVCECLGALGLVLPGLARIRTFLTPLAAAGLTIIMLGAVVVSVLAMGVPAAAFPGVVGMATAWIAYGRTRISPLADRGRRALRPQTRLARNTSMTKAARAGAVSGIALCLALGAAHRSPAQSAPTQYSRMAPIGEYLMADRDVEIALARRAAPESISRDAEILVLGRQGYVSAAKGRNGFVCIVGRGWSSAADPDYWNPKVRVPICMNAPAARSYLVRITKITGLAMQGRSLAQVNDAIAAALARKALPPMASGAMAYMMSKEGYGGDVAPRWPSHLMFFYSDTDPAIWGANLPGSPVFAVADPLEHMTQFVVTTPRWSDGTEDRPATAEASSGSAAPQSHSHP